MTAPDHTPEPEKHLAPAGPSTHDPWPVVSPLGDLVPVPHWLRGAATPGTLTFVTDATTATVFVTEMIEPEPIAEPAE